MLFWIPELALIFEAPKSNGASRYGVLYKGVFAIDGESYATQEDSVESQTVKLKGVFMPLVYNGKPSAKLDTDCEASDTTAKTNCSVERIVIFPNTFSNASIPVKTPPPIHFSFS